MDELRPFQRRFIKAVESDAYDVVALSGPRALGKTYLVSARKPLYRSFPVTIHHTFRASCSPISSRKMPAIGLGGVIGRLIPATLRGIAAHEGSPVPVSFGSSVRSRWIRSGSTPSRGTTFRRC